MHRNEGAGALGASVTRDKLAGWRGANKARRNSAHAWSSRAAPATAPADLFPAAPACAQPRRAPPHAAQRSTAQRTPWRPASSWPGGCWGPGRSRQQGWARRPPTACRCLPAAGRAGCERGRPTEGVAGGVKGSAMGQRASLAWGQEYTNTHYTDEWRGKQACMRAASAQPGSHPPANHPSTHTHARPHSGRSVLGINQPAYTLLHPPHQPTHTCGSASGISTTNTSNPAAWPATQKSR